MSSDLKAPILRHGAATLPTVIVNAYNADLKDHGGFVGDRATSKVLQLRIEAWRQRLRQMGEDDPFGNVPDAAMTKSELGRILADGEPRAAALVHTAVEEFARELVKVIRRFLEMPTWHETSLILIGGGFCGSRLGKIAISRADFLLKASGRAVTLRPIHYDPNEAGLIGCAHLVPRWMFAGQRAILAADIGGSKLRVGLVELNLKTSQALSAARVLKSEIWRHSGNEGSRDDFVEHMAEMLKRLLRHAENEHIAVAPFLGIGCPGLIRGDGWIERGGQNLPAGWEDETFKLPERLGALLPPIGDHPITIVMHNDAVAQGLSESPFVAGVAHWAILTIGTGLGNAHFSARTEPE